MQILSGIVSHYKMVWDFNIWGDKDDMCWIPFSFMIFDLELEIYESSVL